MNPTKDSFESILEKFKKDISKEEAKDFQFVTLKDVEETALRIQKDQDSTRSMKNMARIRPFLEAMEQFGKVVDVFLNASQFVCFVWGPLKFILLTASNWADSFEIIVATFVLSLDSFSSYEKLDILKYLDCNLTKGTYQDAYGKIGSQIPLLEQYSHCFGSNAHMKRILPLIYFDILEFHRRAMRFFRGRQNVWRQVFKSVWKDYTTRYQSILDSLQRHKNSLAEQANLLHMEQSQSDSQRLWSHIQNYEFHRIEMLKKLEHQEKTELERKQVETLRWFSAAKTRSTDHERFRGVREDSAGNGSWILKNEKVDNWMELDTPESSILWINGMPGAGKTILASVIIDACLEKNPNFITSYFYCRESDEEKNDCISICRGILSQLLNKCPELIPYCYDKSISSGDLRLETMEIAKNLLILFCEKLSKQYVIIDGIDECDEGQRKLLLEFWLEVVQKTDERDPGKIRVALVSQSFSDIKKALRDSTVLELKPEDSRKDIEDFTTSWCLKIQERFYGQGEHNDVIEYIKQSTCIKANGMFLFAKLVLENLHAQPNQEQLVNEIQASRFPKGVDEAYQRILDRMKQALAPKEWEIAKKVLGWMVCSKRSLNWREVQAVMSMDLVQQTISFEAKKLRSDIQEYCGSLIQVNYGHQLELVHTTAKIFIVKSNCVHASVVEYNLTGMCLQYLTFDCFSDDIDDESLRNLALKGILSFQDYAIAKWMDHIRATVQIPPEDLHKVESYREALESVKNGIKDFADRYQEDILLEDDIIDAALEDCKPFEVQREFHWDLLNLYNHIYIHSKKEFAERNKISIASLEVILTRNRKMIESLPPPKRKNKGEFDELTEFYGKNRFKCPKTACYYFHEGFKDEKCRDGHIKRHDRPYICTVTDCSSTEFGFVSNKELDKHVRYYHPNVEDLQNKFLTKSKSTSPTPFACLMCPKKFTRKFHLTSHTRSHTGEKPFPCPECGRAFTRANDMRRHEKNIHFGKR